MRWEERGRGGHIGKVGGGEEGMMGGETEGVMQ